MPAHPSLGRAPLIFDREALRASAPNRLFMRPCASLPAPMVHHVNNWSMHRDPQRVGLCASVPCSVKAEHKFGFLKRNMCVRHASGRAESVERLIVPHRWSNWLLHPKLHPFPSSRSQQIQPRSRQRVNVHLRHLLFRCRCSSHHLLLRTKNSTCRLRRARNRAGVAPYPHPFSRSPVVLQGTGCMRLDLPHDPSRSPRVHTECACKSDRRSSTTSIQIPVASALLASRDWIRNAHGAMGDSRLARAATQYSVLSALSAKR